MTKLEQLVERCREGDALAWEAVVKRTQSRVYGLAYHYMRKPEDARDVAQDVFVRFYTKLDRFDGSNVTAWLLGMTRNACIDQLRRRRSRPPDEDLVVEESLPLESRDDDAETDTIRRSRRRLVRRAIGRLSELSREIVLLKDIEGLNFVEISGLLGVPVGTLKSRAHRARLELARKVIEMGADS